MRLVITRRPQASQITALVSFGVVALGLGAISIEPRYGTPWWAIVLPALAGILILVLRERRPLIALAAAVGVAMCSLAWGTGAECLVVLIVLYCIGVWFKQAVAWACFAVTALGASLGSAPQLRCIARRTSGAADT